MQPSEEKTVNGHGFRCKRAMAETVGKSHSDRVTPLNDESETATDWVPRGRHVYVAFAIGGSMYSRAVVNTERGTFSTREDGEQHMCISWLPK